MFLGRLTVAQCCLRDGKELPEMDISRNFLEAKVAAVKQRREDIAKMQAKRPRSLGFLAITDKIKKL